jgi:hypothetical protein
MRQTSAVVLFAAIVAGTAVVSVSAQRPALGDLFGREKGKGQREKEKAERERQRLFGQPIAPISAQPTIVCGMTVIPADPQFDAGIRRAPTTNGRTFTMNTIVPKDCQLPEKK